MHKADILLPRIINVSVMSMGKYHKRAGDKMTVIENYYVKSTITISVIDLIFHYIP